MTTPAPWERLLAENPGDLEQFETQVAAVLAKSKAAGMYRIPLLAGRWKRRVLRSQWERIVRVHLGVTYELGRRSQP